MLSRALQKALFAALLIAVPPGLTAAETAGLETLRAAAEAGQADAQYELGILYEFGYDFPNHKAAAYAWYSRAAEQGNARAAYRRDLLGAELSSAQREQALINTPSTTASPAAR